MISTNDKKIWVIIPAAGVGKRMGSDTPKQYLSIKNKTILEHTLSIFTHRSDIFKVIVVLNSQDTHPSFRGLTAGSRKNKQLQDLAVKPWDDSLSRDDKIRACNSLNIGKVTTTIGGKTRAHSVMNGLKSLPDTVSEDDWVLVHDVARPCLNKETLDRFIHAVQNHSVGGLLALPVADTLKKVGAKYAVYETISREQLWAAQTPQMFRYRVLYKALQQALDTGAVITDESSAVELLGEQPLVVKGNPRNIKITQPEDLRLAELFLGDLK